MFCLHKCADRVIVSAHLRSFASDHGGAALGSKVAHHHQLRTNRCWGSTAPYWSCARHWSISRQVGIKLCVNGKHATYSDCNNKTTKTTSSIACFLLLFLCFYFHVALIASSPDRLSSVLNTHLWTLFFLLAAYMKSRRFHFPIGSNYVQHSFYSFSIFFIDVSHLLYISLASLLAFFRL